MSDPTLSTLVQAALVAAAPAAVPGERLWVGVRYDIAPGWHIYWENPGDSGQATRVELTEQASHAPVGPIHWPAPHRFELPGGLVNHGYEGTATLLLPVDVPAGAGETLHLAGSTRFLVCDPDRCLPGSHPLELTLPVHAALPAGPDLLAADRARLPTPAPSSVSAHWQGTALVVDAPGLTDAAIFPDNAVATVLAGTPTASSSPTRFTLPVHTPPAPDARVVLTGTVGADAVAWTLSLPPPPESP
ncbi:MAG: hypothetical protein H6742_01235 [Alphaproteobacteria bacterium]|nr:hypothetical protein [Alphaproteobacteria bacterium]